MKTLLLMWQMLLLRPMLTRVACFGLVTAVGVATTTAAASAAAVVVRPGDTLSGLAARFHTTASAIARTNHITDPDSVFAGSTLQIAGAPSTSTDDSPSSGSGGADTTTVVVAKGDNLTTLAHRYATTVSSLARLNGISHLNLVRIGQRLKVPTASSSAAAAGLRWLPKLAAADPGRSSLVPVFDHWASTYGVPVSLLEALTWWESGWQSSVVSSTGAVGVGQLEPATVKMVREVLVQDGTLNPRDPADNIQMSAAFLRYLLNRTGGRQDLAVAAYYQGLASVTNDGLLAETKHYVAGILRYATLFGG
ncbi:MAG TPA: LysM peptidoglycan-binding domain-containing protein [Acidimicrobiales bacterium]|nr:LysM peptidoglycan-binding domain-containing protein [Acidimicrobiales bacterium]